MGGVSSGPNPKLACARQAAALIPAWDGLASSACAEPCGGSKGVVFKLSCPGQSDVYCVRILQPGESLMLVSMSRALAARGLCPDVVGSSSTALVQRWIQGSAPSAFHWRDRDSLLRLARFVARLHSLPLEPGTAEAPKARLADLRGLVAGLPPGKAESVGVNLYEVISELESNCGSLLPSRHELVFTHGDLHMGNLIEEGEGRLWAIDLESAGSRPRTTDLAYLFLHMGTNHVLKAYPSWDSRQVFAAAYLQECGKPDDTGAVAELLYEVELEWPFQALWYGIILIYLQTPHFATSLLHSVPHAGRVLAWAGSDAERRQQVLERGVSAIAHDYMTDQ
mmetsp:Transcript_99536/g.252933  ORF Transcript_99536/g.252933 Transcript_99536/m.252933 type:complete len:338 (+) Transcript_99536:82-1095(+)